MRIGDLARQTGTSVRSLRYYEEQGLLWLAAHDDRAADVRGRGRGAGAAAAPALQRRPDQHDDRDRDALRRPPLGASTRETIAVMEREHERLGQQVADLVRTRDQLAYLIDAARGLRARAGDTPPLADLAAS